MHAIAFGTYLLALFLIALTLLIVRVLAPVPIAVRVVGQKGIVRLSGCLHVILKNKRDY